MNSEPLRTRFHYCSIWIRIHSEKKSVSEAPYQRRWPHTRPCEDSLSLCSLCLWQRCNFEIPFGRGAQGGHRPWLLCPHCVTLCDWGLGIEWYRCAVVATRCGKSMCFHQIKPPGVARPEPCLADGATTANAWCFSAVA